MIFLFQKSGNETVFKIPSIFIGAIMGKQARNIHRLETKTGTKIHSENIDDQFKQITIIGDSEKRKKARGSIQGIIVSITYLIF